jgi:hypothetical protein
MFVDDIFPSRDNAPATISAGTAGTGAPSCSSRTLMKINETP